MKLPYKPASSHLLSFFQVIQQVLILTRLWLTGQSHLMLFDTIEQEFCTTSEIKTMNHWDFALLSKGRQYKRGDLHRCHIRENKWHRLYLAQDSLCLFFSSHKPQVCRGRCHLPSPTRTGGSVVGQNPMVPGIVPTEQEDGSCPNSLTNRHAVSSLTPFLSLQLLALFQFKRYYSHHATSNITRP